MVELHNDLSIMCFDNIEKEVEVILGKYNIYQTVTEATKAGEKRKRRKFFYSKFKRADMR